MTSALEAKPQWLLRMPYPGWAPVLAAWFTAAFFLLLTVKLVLPALLCGLIALAALLHWGWGLDPPPLPEPVHIGGGIRLPTYVSGPLSQAWWAMIVLILVSGSLYGCAVFSYLYLWTVSPRLWPSDYPSLGWPLASALLVALSSAAFWFSQRALKRSRVKPMMAAIIAAILFFLTAVGLELAAHWRLSPTETVYGAIVHLLVGLAGFYGLVIFAMALFVVARAAKGLVDPVRRVTFDNARLFWHYAVGQTLVGLALVHGFPRLVA
jgi:heme/copper-type cytochrome/quinol oxidase subunit 3